MTHVLEGTPTAHSADATPLTDEQIDALVAQKVMGWRYEQIDAGGGAYHVRWYDDSGNPVFRYMVSEYSVLGIGWRPSTDIRNAWQVLEKLCANGCTISVVTINRQEWGCNILEKGELFCGIAGTAPRAICLAALKAVQA